MDKNTIKQALGKLKEHPKRKFSQKYDLIITLKDIDVKTTNVDFYATLAHPVGKKLQILGIVGPELREAAEKHFDKVLSEADLEKLKGDTKTAKKLAQTYDWVVAQANLMTNVAAAIGRQLGPRGKMPNPKAGCVVPPNADLRPVSAKLQKTLRIQNKKMSAIQAIVGSEDMTDDQLVENILNIYNNLVKALPNHEQNIKSVLLKKTMSKPVKV